MGAPISLDLQAVKLGSLLLATGHPILSLGPLHVLVADLKRRNREKNALGVDPPNESMALPFPLNGITVVDKKRFTELFGSSKNALRCCCQHLGLFGRPYRALCAWTTLARPPIPNSPPRIPVGKVGKPQ